MNKLSPFVPSFSAMTLAYLLMSLAMGGSVTAWPMFILILQWAGAALVVWSLSSAHFPANRSASPRSWRWFVLSLGLLAAVQFLPLPPAIWSKLSGRAAIAQGFLLLGAAPPWLTFSLTPWMSLSSLCQCIPALALYVALRSPYAPKPLSVAWVILGFALISSLLGLVQYILGQAYVYQFSNIGMGPGFFANSNHQSNFLLIALMMLAFIYFQTEQERAPHANLAFGFAALLLLISIAINRSLAVIGFVPLVTLLLWQIARYKGPKPRHALLMPLLLSVIVGAIVLIGPFGNDLTAPTQYAGLSRHDIWRTALGPLADFAPWGSGLGSFPDLYSWYVAPDIATSTFVNHAHNELLELLCDTGLFGAFALVCFGIWFGGRVWHVWAEQNSSPLHRIATMILFILLLHSLVEYPLRTATLSCIFAIGCAWLQPRRPSSSTISAV